MLGILYCRSPPSGLHLSTSYQIRGSIRVEINKVHSKWNALESSRKPFPSPCSWKSCLPGDLSCCQKGWDRCWPLLWYPMHQVNNVQCLVSGSTTHNVSLLHFQCTHRAWDPLLWKWIGSSFQISGTSSNKCSVALSPSPGEMIFSGLQIIYNTDVVVVELLSPVQLFVIPPTGPVRLLCPCGIFRQVYFSGLPYPH